LQQGKIRLVLTTPFDPESEISHHIRMHGDGVKMIALWVDDARSAFHETTSRGAKPFMQPKEEKDENGTVVISGIHTYGDTVHLFVERKNYNGIFLPGYEKWVSEYNPTPTGLEYIDHMVGNVELGAMNKWARFYEEVMGFANLITFDDKDISTSYTALMSKVMTNGNGRIKFPINEPADGLKKSQIEEYLDFYKGAGCQHIAVATNNIVFTISEMRRRGVEFLYVPGTYYDTVGDRVGIIEEDMEVLKKLGIMVDRDEEGYLLQIFTKPVEDRPTVFFEIIQRKGAKSFGKGNFKALFESIEAEQARRGTL
jgi:4-hydroxyphenylpyruvate dioxygenase